MSNLGVTELIVIFVFLVVFAFQFRKEFAKEGLIRSIVAIVSGFILVTVIQFGAFSLLGRLFPYLFERLAAAPPQNLSRILLFQGPTFLTGIIGGYTTAYLAKSSPVKHAIVLGVTLGIPDFISIFSGFMPEYFWDWLGGIVISFAAAYSGGKLRARSLGVFEKFLQISSAIHGGIPMNSKSSQTTRYLAGSALLSGSSFRRKVLEFFSNRFNAYAPELGYDPGIVVRLCRYFESRETKYQTALLVLSILFLYFTVLEAGLIAVIVVFLLIASIVRFHQTFTEHKLIIENFRQSTFQPDEVLKKFDAFLELDIVTSIDQDEGTLVIYNRFNPFIGAGTNMGGWSFVIDLSKPKEGKGQGASIQDFRIEELYEFIASSLDDLKVKGLTIKDVLFVNGSDIRNKQWILPDMFARPTTNASPEKVKEYLDKDESQVRFYKWIRVYDWGNELVVSYFLRYARRGKNLFAEVSAFLLTPLSEDYKRVDSITPLDVRKVMELGIKTIIIAPFSIVASWFAIVSKVLISFSKILDSKNKELKRIIKNNPLYNYGASETLRENLSSNQYAHYFQLLDKEMYSKIIERELLEAFIKFLDKHNIDTSDLKEREASIINSGIIVQGGDVKAGALAVGSGAKAETKTQTTGLKLASRIAKR